MTVLKRVGVWSVSRMLGVLYAALGFLVGGIFTLISLVVAAVGMASGEGEAAFGILFGVGAIVIAPIFYGTIGLVFGALGAFIYNLAAGVVGGIEFELE
jgi:hypothetical protein